MKLICDITTTTTLSRRRAVLKHRCSASHGSDCLAKEEKVRFWWGVSLTSCHSLFFFSFFPPLIQGERPASSGRGGDGGNKRPHPRRRGPVSRHSLSSLVGGQNRLPLFLLLDRFAAGEWRRGRGLASLQMSDLPTTPRALPPCASAYRQGRYEA